jgi:glycosyltransferase involved in cell wall biosynthesis
MQLIAFLNSYTKGISGGDIRFIELAKRFNSLDITVVTSKLGQSLCQKKGLNARYIITTKESEINSIILLFIKRILKALSLNLHTEFNTSERVVLYSTSDFLPDVLPAYKFKRKHNETKWVQLIHHLYIHPSKRIGNSLFSNLFGFLSQRISFFFIKHYSDLIIIVNNIVKEELIKSGFEKEKIIVIPNGVNAAYLENIDADSNITYDAVFMARLNRSKGIFDLIKIWMLIVKEKPKARLAIIGGGNKKLEKELIANIYRYNLEKNIDVLGYLEDCVAYSLIKGSKVFIFPSHEEGFGISILEAMCCGVPVVAWDLPVYSEIFPKGMIQVPEGDINVFSDVLLNLLNDKHLLNKMSKEATEVALIYNWEKIAEQEEEIIKEVVK